MSNETETLKDSINTTADFAIKEVKTPSVHPAAGVVGVSTIGGLLGAIVAGPIGAILGGTLGVLGASIENTKSGKSGYYTSRNRSTQLVGAISDELTQARKAGVAESRYEQPDSPSPKRRGNKTSDSLLPGEKGWG